MRCLTGLLLLCLAGTSASQDDASLAHTLEVIDEKIQTFLRDGCTEARATLCTTLRSFRIGALPASQQLSYDFYVGSLYTIHSTFKESLEYSKSYGLLVVESDSSGHSARFEQLTSESDAERSEVDAAKQALASGHNPGGGALKQFVQGLSKTGSYAKCTAMSRTLACLNESNRRTPLVLLREHEGSLYLVALGRVPFRAGSFDEVPGLFISSFVLGRAGA